MIYLGMGAILDKRDSDNDPISNFMPFLTKPYYVGTALLGTCEDWVPKIKAPKGNTQTVL